MDNVVSVFEQIQRSVRTLKKLPPVAVKNRYCNWPEVIHSFFDAYGWNDPVMPKFSPTARQLTELDQVINWLAWLSRYGEEYNRIIWARANRIPWSKIAAIAGMPPSTCQHRFREGCYAIYYAIENNKLK